MTSTRQQVGRLFVEGTSAYAEVFEMRINKRYVLESFVNDNPELYVIDAFERAVQWAMRNQ